MTLARNEPLYDEHIKYLARQAHAIGVPAHEVDDIVQDTLLKAVELMPAFRGDAKKTTWLYKILLNVWRNGNRRIARRIRKHHNYEAQCRAIETAWGEGSEFDAELGLAIRELREFVDSLSPEEREAFVARAIRGFGRSEAAELLGIQPAVLDRRLVSANGRFDDRFDQKRSSTSRHPTHQPAKRTRGVLGVTAPALKWWTHSSAARLLTLLACFVGGLYLIAATTPDTRKMIPRRTIPPLPSMTSQVVAREEVAPILVELDDTDPIPIVAKAPHASLASDAGVDDTWHLARGRELRYENRLEEALAHIRAIDSLGPLARERWGNEVGILCQLQRLDEAITASSLWLAAYPEDLERLSRSCVRQQRPPD